MSDERSAQTKDARARFYIRHSSMRSVTIHAREH
jgi:hypothetical protein